MAKKKMKETMSGQEMDKMGRMQHGDDMRDLVHLAQSGKLTMKVVPPVLPKMPMLSSIRNGGADNG